MRLKKRRRKAPESEAFTPEPSNKDHRNWNIFRLDDAAQPRILRIKSSRRKVGNFYFKTVWLSNNFCGFTAAAGDGLARGREKAARRRRTARPGWGGQRQKEKSRGAGAETG